MSEERWVEVWKGNNDAEIRAAGDALHAAGIEVRIAARGGLHGQGARLTVKADDAARARELIPKASGGKKVTGLLRKLLPPIGPGRM